MSVVKETYFIEGPRNLSEVIQ